MRIANPMYDAAFKYLMDDQAAARLLVGAVLGAEIVSLEALPQERSGRPSPAGDPSSAEMLTVRRVDCAATVLRVAREYVDGVNGERLSERETPERYASVLRRLEGAAASEEVADSMALEDEVADTLGRMKRESAEKDAVLQRERAAAEQRIAELERRLAESGGA